MGRSASRARLALALAVAAPMLFGACTAYRAVGPGTAAPPSAPVRVHFAEPRRLHVVAAGGDTTALDGVSELTGELVAASGDTLAVRLQTLDRATAHAGATVRFVRRPADRAEARQPDAGSTILLVLAAGLLIVGAIGFGSASGGGY